MHATKITLLILGVLLACGPVTTRAQMYKWVDERGAVTYTNVPPPEAKTRGGLELVHPGNGAVSTYSSAEVLGIRGISASSSQDRTLRERVAQLERELEIERRARAMAGEMLASRAAQEAQKLKERRERCIADRRTDCDRPDIDEVGGTSMVVAARHPQIVRQIIVRPLLVPAAARLNGTRDAARAVHQAHLAHRPPERRPAFHRAPTLSAPPQSIVLRVGNPRRF